MNQDPETRLELAPRIHPNGRIEGDSFVDTRSGREIPLEPDVLALLRRCDGTSPAHSWGIDLDTLKRLADESLILWRVEVPALDPMPSIQ